jgi:hypothetical protein
MARKWKCWFKGNKRCTNWSWNAQINKREDKNKSRLIGRDKRKEEETQKKKLYDDQDEKEECSHWTDSIEDEKGRKKRRLRDLRVRNSSKDVYNERQKINLKRM